MLQTKKISEELSNDEQYNFIRQNILLEPGINELQQLNVALNLSSLYMKKISENFFTIRSKLVYNTSVKIMNNYIQIFVHESRRFVSNSTRFRFEGGSGFFTIAEGATSIAYCPYVDHANDSYTIYCPLHENCVTIVSHLLYFDYLSFAANVDRHSANKMIFRKRLCGTTNLTFPQNTLHWSKRVGNSSESQSATNVFPWHLQLNNNNLITDDQLMQCRQLSNMSLYFIGDSHCRYLAYHVLQKLGKETGPKKLHADYNVGNIHYFYAPYTIENVLPRLHNLLTNLRTNQFQAKVIFDAGSWDVNHRNISYFATSVIPAIQNSMIAMQRAQLFDKTKVIFFDMPPVPLSDRGTSTRRNLMALAAGNRLLADTMRNVNIKYVDYFALSHVFVNHSAPNDGHYLIVVNKTSSGDVGIQIANYILQLICEEFI